MAILDASKVDRLSFDEIATIVKLWRESLSHNEWLENQLPLESKSKSQVYVLGNLSNHQNLADLFNYDGSELTFEVDQKYYQAFNGYLRNQQELAKKAQSGIKNRVRLGRLYLGFPVFYFKNNSGSEPIYAIESLFKWEIVSADSTEKYQIKIRLNPKVNTTKKLLLDGDKQSKKFDERSIIENLLRGASEHHDKQQKDNELDDSTSSSTKLSQNIFKYIKDLTFLDNLDSLNQKFSFVIYHKMADILPTTHLQSELVKLTKVKFWQELAKQDPANMALEFMGAKRDSQQPGQGGYKFKFLCSGISQTHLSDSKRLVITAMQKNRLTLVEGPPGTGKTRLIRVLALNELYKRCLELALSATATGEDNNLDHKLTKKTLVLITSPNNSAVDQALGGSFLANKSNKGLFGDRLSRFFPVQIRVGNRWILAGKTLDNLKEIRDFLSAPPPPEGATYRDDYQVICEEFVQNQDIWAKIEDPAQLLKVLGKFHYYWVLSNYQRVLEFITFLIEKIDQGKSLSSLLAHESRQQIFSELFPIIGCTLLSLKHFSKGLLSSVNLCMIDEAAQSLPVQVLPVLTRSDYCLLLGDTYQIPPIIQNSEHYWHQLAASIEGEGEANIYKRYPTYFPTKSNRQSSQKFAALNVSNKVILQEHYRSQKELVNFCDQLCDYGLKVLTPSWQNPSSLMGKTSFWYYTEKGDDLSLDGSWQNEQEANRVVYILRMLKEKSTKMNWVAVLSPYRAQVELINSLLRKHKIRASAYTIHAFQGKQSQIVIFSAVLSATTHKFLNSMPNLLNSAVSRARDYFIFVGDIDNLDAQQSSYSNRPTKALKNFLLAGGNLKELIEKEH
ncbi:MAG: hypothetical protein JJV97_01910 [SAR324 cluster bacterium]|nr:hypothetical protein [SAR324 cluster bacterium]